MCLLNSCETMIPVCQDKLEDSEIYWEWQLLVKYEQLSF